MKFAPQSLRSLGLGPKNQDVTLIQKLGNCLCGLVRGHICHNMLHVKWSWNTRTLATLGDLFGSMVISMLVKSTYKRSIGAVDTIGCRDTLSRLPSCCKQCMYRIFMDCCTWLVIPGHQKHSHNSDSVWSHHLMTHILVAPIQGGNMVCPWGPQRAGYLQFCL